MLQTCPNHLSKSPCELRFSRLLLPESHAQCVLIHTGTPDSQVRFGQKGCISKTVVDKGAFIRGPIRGLYEVNTRSAYMVCPGARHELLKRDCSTWAGNSSGGGSSSSRRKQQQAAASSSQQQPHAATSMCPLERMTKYKYKFEKSWQKWLSGQHLYTIVSIGIPMEVAARFKRATFKLSCKTQAKRKKYRLTPIAFPHGNEPFNCKQNRFPHPPVAAGFRDYKL